MALYTVDVYSGSSDNIIRDPHAQGVIIKATQGTGYVNPMCNHQWNLAGQLGKLRGLYHYAGGGNPETEAQYFINNIRNYVGQAVLILDWESYQNASWGNPNWANRFTTEVHRLTGVWPLIYVQESALWQVANCAHNCGVWVAKYASMNWHSWTLPNMSVSAGAFGALTGWQFTGGDMDRSIFYIDANAWKKIANPSAKITPAVDNGVHGSLDSLAFNGDNFTVAGWAASNQTKDKQYAYVILTDEKNHELARFQVKLEARPDVAKAYPKIANAGQSGFSATFKYTTAMRNHKINAIFRYTDDPAGNGRFVDYNSKLDFTKSAAYLDTCAVQMFSNKLHVSGWFASNISLGMSYGFLILYDTDKKRELQRITFKPTERPDVHAKYQGIYKAGMSGFAGDFDYSSNLTGHKLQVIARYSDDSHGEGNHVDHWFEPFKAPEMPTVDGKTEQSILVHEFSVKSQKDGKMLLTFK